MNKLAKLVLGAAVIVILAVVAVIAIKIYKESAPGTEMTDLVAYYGIPDNEMLVIVDDRVYEKNALYENGQVYIGLNLLQAMNDRFFWDSSENLLLYTTATEIVKAGNNNSFFYSNKNKVTTDYPPVKAVGTDVYVAMEYLAPYTDCKYQIYENPNRIVIQYQWGDYLFSDVTKATQLRVNSDRKSEILVELAKGDRVMYVDSGGSQKNGFFRVMTDDGIRGYISEKVISDSFYVTVSSEFEAPEYTHISKEHSINLVWHMIVNQEANQYFDSLVGATKGVTVIAPTWFNVSTESGQMESRASVEYVEKAHNMGLEVWAVVSNFHPDSAQAKEIDQMKLLSKFAHRETFVNEIVAAAIKYDLDGINIDFESMQVEEGPFFLQFLRELSVKCRNNGLVLSVDNYVPAPYNSFYDLEEQAVIADYVVIMGYDEHYEGSSEAGSVSSIKFFQDAINNTLASVPAERFIMGLPFYTRLWKETTVDGVTNLSSEALGMTAADNTLTLNNAEYVWQEEAGQFYSEYTKGDTLYRIWLEEETSIELKMKSIFDAGLAGVAEWRLGFEKPSAWNVIQRYLR